MKKIFLLLSSMMIGIILSSLIIFSCDDKPPEPFNPEPYVIKIPRYFPTKLNIPDDNPMTVPGVRLGRYLFYDGRMSGRLQADSMMCCASCHRQESNFEPGPGIHKYSVDGRTKGMPHPAYPDGKPTPHAPMALVNLVFNNNGYLWNGMINANNKNLGSAAYGVPPLPQYHMKNIESLTWMGIAAPHEFNGKVEWTVAAIKSDPMYPPMFKAAFGTEEITYDRISKALAQFIRSITATDTKFHKWLRKEGVMLTAAEYRGYEIFMSEKGDCFHCHGEQSLLTTNQFYNNAKDTCFTGPCRDTRDRFAVTKDSLDLGAYKAPSLINCEFTGPYMHDGRFTTLEQVIDFYSDGQKYSPYTHPLMKYVKNGGVRLTTAEKADLLAFLKTLTDNTMLTNPAYSKPSDLTVPSE